MFTFEDKGGRSLTLRPEGTAPICRAYVEHGMQKLRAAGEALPTAGPFFRHERPQAGRYRQFHQIGAEAIGTDSPLADAESIGLLAELLARARRARGRAAARQPRLARGARAPTCEELKAHLHANEGELSEDVRERIDVNPLRAFDSDHEGTRGVMASAPKLVERLEGEDAEHFDEVRALLDAAGVEYAIDPTLVRGLDYYTRTIFSFVCDRLGAQSEIGGGGRYDGLVEQLGGPPTPAVGWAAGIERILLALGERRRRRAPRRLHRRVADVGRGRRAGRWRWPASCAAPGLAAEVDLAGRSLKGQLKHADRIGAGHVVILEDDGSAQLRDMESGEQGPVRRGDLVAEIERRS